MEGNLVLSRKEGESVILKAPNGLPVVVTVLEIDRGKVRLSFRADKSVVVIRSELAKEGAA